MQYDYHCTTCGHEWTTEQRITDEALTVCPECGDETARRLVTGGAGFVLRGGGWARNGYGAERLKDPVQDD